MIVQFDIVQLSPEVWIATAILLEELPVDLGAFDDEDEAAEACVQFETAYVKRLH